MKFFVPHESFDFTGWCNWNSIAAIGILSGFDDPDSFLFLELLTFEFLNADVIFISRNDMVCVRQEFKRINFLYFWVIPMHEFEEDFFWSNDGVVGDMICQDLKIDFGMCRLESQITSGVRCIGFFNLFGTENFLIVFLWVRRFSELIFQTESWFSIGLLITVEFNLFLLLKLF